MVLHLKKLRNLNLFHPMKLVKWIWRRLLFNIFNIIYILLLFPLGKGCGPSFEQTWMHFSRGCFMPSLVKSGPVVLEKKLNMRKVYRQTEWQMNRRQTTCDQKSSLELKTYSKKLLFYKFCVWFITQEAQGLNSHLSTIAHNNTAHHK